MARSEARLSVSIWLDDDFLALSPGAQRMFMFLLSQPDLAHDGVIALRERRWSKKAAGLTVAQVGRDLEELAVGRFVVVDEDAEELLIRSFIRRDKVYRQPNVLRAAQDHLAVVTSPAILATLAAELRRIATAEDIGEASASIVAEMLTALEKAAPNPSENPSRNPSDEGSGNPSGNPSAATPGERGVVTAVSSDSPFPDSSRPDPLPSAARPGEDDVIDAEIVDTQPALVVVADPADSENAGQVTKQWIDHCKANGVKLTGQVIKRYGAGIKRALDEGFTVDLIKRALAAMLTDRVASRPALLDTYLIRTQQGPELPPQRASRTEASMARTGTSSTAALIRDALTRPA